MIILDNQVNSTPFSLVLRDKVTQTNPVLSLKLTKQDTLDVFEFSLVNLSTSEDYYTFSINASGLNQGDYVAEIYEYVGGTADCEVLVPEAVVIDTLFECDPVDVEAQWSIEAEALISQSLSSESKIWIGKARVDGIIYNPIYTYTTTPTYYVYNE